MKRFGIDVSKWQGAKFDFNKAKSEGVEFVILRGAYTTGKDTLFEKYYAACKLYNLPVGVYQYSMAQTVAEAKKEAEFLYNNVLKGKQFEYPIYIDIEDKTQLALSKDLLTNIAITWCEYLEAKGYFVGIYSGKYIFRDNMHDDKLKGYTHWLAMWSTACTYEDKTVLGMWQFGGDTNKLRSNKIAGVVCDQNYAYADFPSVIKAKGLNGYPKQQVAQNTAQKPSIDAKVEAAKETVQTKAGLEDKTIEYLMKYEFGTDLIIKLANAMK